MERHQVFGHNEDTDEWKQASYRDSLWTDDGRLTGIVSSNEDFYKIIQYEDILKAVGSALEKRPEDIEPSGWINLSPTAHKMSARIGVDQTVEPTPGDVIETDLRVRSGHSGFHGVKYEPGALRQVCENGMMAFIADQQFEQNHGEEFQPGLAMHAVDSVVEGADQVEERLEQAQERTLRNQDEALLILQDIGIDRYLENPTPDLITALNDQAEDLEEPSLYDTFNAATYALTHLAEDDIPQYQLDTGFERAGQILEYGDGIPHPDILGENAVRRRANELIEDPDTEEYWDGETESVRELMEEYEIQA